MLRPRRLFLSCLALAVSLPLSPAAADGQTAGSCDYDACALRLEHRLGTVRVVRGVHQEPVTGMGPFGAGLAPVVAGSDSAVVHALRSDRERRAATVLGVVAAAAGAVYLWSVGDSLGEGDRGAVVPVSAGVAVVVGLVGGWQASRSLNSLERSVWWYNRDMARDPAR